MTDDPLERVRVALADSIRRFVDPDAVGLSDAARLVDLVGVRMVYLVSPRALAEHLVKDAEVLILDRDGTPAS